MARPFQRVYMFYVLRNGSSQLGERVLQILQTEILLHIYHCILHTRYGFNLRGNVYDTMMSVQRRVCNKH